MKEVLKNKRGCNKAETVLGAELCPACPITVTTEDTVARLFLLPGLPPTLGSRRGTDKWTHSHQAEGGARRPRAQLPRAKTQRIAPAMNKQELTLLQ